MHRRTFTTLSLAALLAACGKAPEPTPAASATPEPAPAELEPVADALALRNVLERTRASSGMPALAGAIVKPDGDIIGATGLRAARGTDTVKLDDAWHIGGNTQAMTAALYAKLVEAGKLKWGAPLAELFPKLQLDPAWRATTIEQALSHTAGVTDVGAPWIVARRADKRPLTEQRLDTVREALGRPRAGQAGAFADAGLDYIIAGAAIEQATGKSWEDAIGADLFKPLGMAHAAFGAPQGEGPRGHRGDAGGRLIPMGDGPESDGPAAMAPASGVNLPLADWARFVRLFIDPAQVLLSADSLKRLTTPAGGSTSAAGWSVGDAPKLGRALRHSGSNTMWYSTALLSPERQAGVLLATNCATVSAQRAIDALAPALLAASLKA
jgi:CubicO group peptidase (beta-lactamase class C family)